MVIQKEKLRQKSGTAVLNGTEDLDGANSNDPIHWCHREYSPKRFVAVGNAVDLMALGGLGMLVIFVLIGCYDLKFRCGIQLNCGFSYCELILVNPVTWLIFASGFPVLFKPCSIRVTERGLEIRQMFGIRLVPWQKVKVQFDRHANLKVNLDGRYTFVVKDDFEKFEHLQDDLITFAAEIDRSKLGTAKSEPVRFVRQYSPLCGVLSDAYINRPQITSKPKKTQSIELPPLSGT